jgi:hypothetical protein
MASLAPWSGRIFGGEAEVTLSWIFDRALPVVVGVVAVAAITCSALGLILTFLLPLMARQ